MEALYALTLGVLTAAGVYLLMRARVYPCLLYTSPSPRDS